MDSWQHWDMCVGMLAINQHTLLKQILKKGKNTEGKLSKVTVLRIVYCALDKQNILG